MTPMIADGVAKPFKIRKAGCNELWQAINKTWSALDEQIINRCLRAQQPNASSEMFGITSLPVWERLWSYQTLSEPAIMVCTNVLVLKSKHSQSCYLLSLFPFTQKFCLSFSKVPLSIVRRDRFHKACYCVWDCSVAEIGVHAYSHALKIQDRTCWNLWKYCIIGNILWIWRIDFFLFT